MSRLESHLPTPEVKWLSWLPLLASQPALAEETSSQSLEDMLMDLINKATGGSLGTGDGSEGSTPSLLFLGIGPLFWSFESDLCDFHFFNSFNTWLQTCRSSIFLWSTHILSMCSVYHRWLLWIVLIMFVSSYLFNCFAPDILHILLSDYWTLFPHHTLGLFSCRFLRLQHAQSTPKRLKNWRSSQESDCFESVWINFYHSWFGCSYLQLLWLVCFVSRGAFLLYGVFAVLKFVLAAVGGLFVVREIDQQFGKEGRKTSKLVEKAAAQIWWILIVGDILQVVTRWYWVSLRLLISGFRWSSSTMFVLGRTPWDRV